MLSTWIQIAAVVLIGLYLAWWRKGMLRQEAQTWETLLARLRTEWSARGLNNQFLWKEGLTSSPEEVWRNLEGPRGLWVIYQNARVMAEMADYASKKYRGVDPLLIEMLHRDAVQIQASVLTAMTQYTFNRASDSVRTNAYRAVSSYTGMAARVTRLLQQNAGSMVPDFVAAM